MNTITTIEHSVNSLGVTVLSFPDNKPEIQLISGEQPRIPAGEMERLLRGTDIGYELSIPGPAEIKVGPGGAAIQPLQPAGLPGPAGPASITGNLQQQPPVKNTSPVNINVNFPGK